MSSDHSDRTFWAAFVLGYCPFAIRTWQAKARRAMDAPEYVSNDPLMPHTFNPEPIVPSANWLPFTSGCPEWGMFHQLDEAMAELASTGSLEGSAAGEAHRAADCLTGACQRIREAFLKKDEDTLCWLYMRSRETWETLVKLTSIALSPKSDLNGLRELGAAIGDARLRLIDRTAGPIEDLHGKIGELLQLAITNHLGAESEELTRLWKDISDRLVAGSRHLKAPARRDCLHNDVLLLYAKIEEYLDVELPTASPVFVVDEPNQEFRLCGERIPFKKLPRYLLRFVVVLAKHPGETCGLDELRRQACSERDTRGVYQYMNRIRNAFGPAIKNHESVLAKIDPRLAEQRLIFNDPGSGHEGNEGGYYLALPPELVKHIPEGVNREQPDAPASRDPAS